MASPTAIASPLAAVSASRKAGEDKAKTGREHRGSVRGRIPGLFDVGYFAYVLVKLFRLFVTVNVPFDCADTLM